ncbi:hypothetical protein VMCG_09751 [Cytospora schulzeri]|uniref:Beta-lactamase-related domain-containing protein n=1 Tax=Cytospora schulzeri TaxID=448051 RepID=A0A423VH33_9PEZI|nr:hypothetical protein VMCG_09751 [Valsa malicola]
MNAEQPHGNLPGRLDALRPQIEELMRIAGTAGLSVGVHRDGSAPYCMNFGLRDVKNNLAVTEKTIFPACSLTKLFTAMSLGTIIDDSDISLGWSTRIKDILPDFDIADDLLREHMTIADALSHRTGMSVADFYLGSDNNIIIPYEDSLKFISDQVPISPFRQEWGYNNLGYELAGLVLNKVLHPRGYGDVIRESFLKPLGMRRTYMKRPPSDIEDVSKAYNTLDDGTPTEIPTVKAAEGSFGGSSGGMFTCVADLLKAYTAVMEAAGDQFMCNRTFTDGLPIKRAAEIFSSKMPLNQPTFTESSYAFGVARLQLPGQMGYIGFNPGLVPDGMPTVAKNTPSRLILYHQGSLPGALSSIVMIPSLRITAVVMSNSLALNDCPDWVMQLLLEEILEAPDRNNFIAYSKTSAQSTLGWYEKTIKALKDAQKTGTSPSKPLEDYVGTYWNKKRHIKVNVTLKDGKLSWAIQGLESEKFELDHYQDDVFTWIRPRNYMAARGRWVDNPPIFWEIRFTKDKSANINCLNWTHDPDVPAGEDFFRDKNKTRENL